MMPIKYTSDNVAVTVVITDAGEGFYVVGIVGAGLNPMSVHHSVMDELITVLQHAQSDWRARLAEPPRKVTPTR